MLNIRMISKLLVRKIAIDHFHFDGWKIVQNDATIICETAIYVINRQLKGLSDHIEVESLRRLDISEILAKRDAFHAISIGLQKGVGKRQHRHSSREIGKCRDDTRNQFWRNARTSGVMNEQIALEGFASTNGRPRREITLTAALHGKMPLFVCLLNLFQHVNIIGMGNHNNLIDQGMCVKGLNSPFYQHLATQIDKKFRHTRLRACTRSSR